MAMRRIQSQKEYESCTGEIFIRRLFTNDFFSMNYLREPILKIDSPSMRKYYAFYEDVDGTPYHKDMSILKE